MRVVWMLFLAAAAAICALVGGVTAQAGRPSDGPDLVKMGVNDARSGTIGHRGDVDTYEVTVTEAGIFRFAVLNIPKEVMLGREIAELSMSLTGPNDFRWSHFTRDDARSFKSPPFALPPGTYRIRIKDYFGDAASGEAYTIQTIFQTCDDPGEPNDTPATATPLKSGRSATGYILPADDKDYYRIRLLTPGRVSITVKDIPPEIRATRRTKALYLGVFDQRGRLLKEYTSQPRQDTLETGEEVMNKGTYVLCVRDFAGEHFSGSPYTITATFPGVKGQLSEVERDLLAAVAEQFKKSDDRIDTAEREILERLEALFLQD